MDKDELSESEYLNEQIIISQILSKGIIIMQTIFIFISKSNSSLEINSNQSKMLNGKVENANMNTLMHNRSETAADALEDEPALELVAVALFPAFRVAAEPDGRKDPVTSVGAIVVDGIKIPDGPKMTVVPSITSVLAEFNAPAPIRYVVPLITASDRSMLKVSLPMVVTI